MINLLNMEYRSLPRKITIIIMLIILSIGGNLFDIPLFLGLGFQLGSIPILIILYTYGLKYGVIAAIISNIYKVILLGHPFRLAVYVLETIFIGLFLKRKKRNIILIDCLYWVGLGIPFIYISHTSILNMTITEAVFNMLRYSVNGIFNAFCASLIIFYISTRRWYAGLNKEKTILANEIFFNLVVGAVLASNLFISISHSKKELIWYSENIQLYYIRSLSITLVSIILASFISMLLRKFLIVPIEHLAEVTNQLPSKIFDKETIKWPRSFIREVDSVINNFKNTSNILNDNFIKVQKANRELEYLANHDPLTKLTNRFVFNKKLDKSIEYANKNDKKLAVMFLDLDRFKLINDTFGHKAGDQLLIEISRRLITIIGDEDVVCRMSGDEFTFLISNIESEKDAAKIADDILNILQERYVLEEQEINISASMGISFYPQDGNKTEILLKKADIAMYRAKDNGKCNYKFYNDDMDSQGIQRFKMENHLRKALEKEELTLYYQPRVDSKSEGIKAVEALIRWNSPEFGMVSPVQFIPIAEETGLIIPIGEWVLRTACKQNKLWQEAGYKPLRVSVNLSALQFAQSNLLDKIGEILEEAKLDPYWLELEITESIVIKDIQFTIDTLERLKEMGVKVSLDDFGTGFSSLNYLKNFKIDTLKIDSSFVRDINGDNKNTAIVNAIISLGTNLDLNVTAEGVETITQLDFLKLNGCHEIQGYLYSKPVPPKEFERLIEERKLFIGEN